eukprot:4939774-Heterocapsa_arctica.AAC.1
MRCGQCVLDDIAVHDQVLEALGHDEEVDHATRASAAGCRVVLDRPDDDTTHALHPAHGVQLLG